MDLNVVLVEVVDDYLFRESIDRKSFIGHLLFLITSNLDAGTGKNKLQ